MPPDAVIEGQLYGIVKDGDVKTFIQTMTSSQRDELNNVIDSLQDNPRPASATTVTYDIKLMKLVVDRTRPNYTILYTVDEQRARVTIIAIQEKRFS